jgi:hypothetical protein
MWQMLYSPDRNIPKQSPAKDILPPGFIEGIGVVAPDRSSQVVELGRAPTAPRLQALPYSSGLQVWNVEPCGHESHGVRSPSAAAPHSLCPHRPAAWSSACAG